MIPTGSETPLPMEQPPKEAKWADWKIGARPMHERRPIPLNTFKHVVTTRQKAYDGFYDESLEYTTMRHQKIQQLV